MSILLFESLNHGTGMLVVACSDPSMHVKAIGRTVVSSVYYRKANDAGNGKISTMHHLKSNQLHATVEDQGVQRRAWCRTLNPAHARVYSAARSSLPWKITTGAVSATSCHCSDAV